MYSFSCFKTNDQKAILELIEENPFAFLTGSFLSGLQVATQIPVLMEEKDGELYFQGHIMRNTDHHKAFLENPNVLLVFTGPDCYVSASWYQNPQNGSTWNYMSVHITGTIRILKEAEKIAFMRKLSLKFEHGNTDSPTVYDQLPEDYTAQMMPAIDGFEIKAEKIDHVFKLSQNRELKSYQNIISRLEERGGKSALIAAEMKKRIDVISEKNKE